MHPVGQPIPKPVVENGAEKGANDYQVTPISSFVPPTPLENFLNGAYRAAFDTINSTYEHTTASMVAYGIVWTVWSAGMTASQAGALAYIVSAVSTAIGRVMDSLGFVRRHDYSNFTIQVINTFVIVAAIATALGISIPAAKGMLLIGGAVLAAKFATRVGKNMP